MCDPTFPLKPYSVISLEFSETESKMGTTSHSLANIKEAEFVTRLSVTLAKICSANEQCSIGAISPYAEQKEQFILADFRSEPFQFLTVDTIESYQSREVDIMILCTAWYQQNCAVNVSALINVALTRAKKALIVCGNFRSLMVSEYLQSFWNRLLTLYSHLNSRTAYGHRCYPTPRNVAFFTMCPWKVMINCSRIKFPEY